MKTLNVSIITKTLTFMASKNKESIYLPVKDYPYLKEFKAQFAVQEDEVAFPYKGKIYSNQELSEELVEHEKVHFKQQEEIGADEWVKEYLANPNFRVKMEVEAYRHQLSLHNDKNMKEAIRIQIAKVLSSPMYGNVLTYKEAYSKVY